ncbi:hypothetical protein [Marinimicrobium sp. C2-29]|uniref:hypothetical protein n=1 Tax=Marinimicrobium sp. C2-29 TaxID=3139825 RepID=UPI003138BF79
MAINENTNLKNNHTLYLANSGFGKSQTLQRRGGIPNSSCRVALWDNNKDHKAHRFESLAEYVKALARAHRSGKGFRIAYVGDPSPAAFEVWAHALWEIADGNRTTYGVVEEYADCCEGPGAINPKRLFYHRRLWTQGRKYGVIIHATSQRPQLITKDAFQAGHIWASYMDFDAAVKAGKALNINHSELGACQPGEFWYRGNGKPAEKIKVFTPL